MQHSSSSSSSFFWHCQNEQVEYANIIKTLNSKREFFPPSSPLGLGGPATHHRDLSATMVGALQGGEINME